jgi:polysaccharide export outer membrane protein
MFKYLLFLGSALISLFATAPSLALPLSPGDRLKLTIPEGDEFNGIYEVNLDGKLQIPYLTPVPVAGLEPEQAQRALSQALVNQGLFQPSFLQVSLIVVQWSAVKVFISGEIFSPGRVLINVPSGAERTQTPVPAGGEYPVRRDLATALKDAGGVTPKADITAVQLIRGRQTYQFDLSRVLTGESFLEIPLISGDQIVIPSKGQFQNALVRPSAITPSAVEVYLSNLTVPASSNAASGVNREAVAFNYGSRFSQAVVAANCAGGTRGTNAGRRALLVSTDRLTGATTHVERRVDDILKNSHNDADNPYLMPNDVMACYDSRFIQVRDVMESIFKILSPMPLIRGLTR